MFFPTFNHYTRLGERSICLSVNSNVWVFFFSCGYRYTYWPAKGYYNHDHFRNVTVGHFLSFLDSCEVEILITKDFKTVLNELDIYTQNLGGKE